MSNFYKCPKCGYKTFNLEKGSMCPCFEGDPRQPTSVCGTEMELKSTSSTSFEVSSEKSDD
jgi:hypothetical protein